MVGSLRSPNRGSRKEKKKEIPHTLKKEEKKYKYNNNNKYNINIYLIISSLEILSSSLMLLKEIFMLFLTKLLTFRKKCVIIFAYAFRKELYV